MLDTLFFKWTVGFYLLGTGFYLWHLIRKREVLDRTSFWATVAGFLAHSVALAVRLAEMDSSILAITLHEAMAFFSWALVLVFLLVEYRYRIQVLGSLILPLASLSILSCKI